MSGPGDSHAQEMAALLDTLWKSNYGVLMERVGILRDAREKLAAGSLDDQSRKSAEEAAHNLAGILGTFGLPQGSALASKIEVWLAQKAPPGANSADVLRSWVDELEAIIASRP